MRGYANSANRTRVLLSRSRSSARWFVCGLTAARLPSSPEISNESWAAGIRTASMRRSTHARASRPPTEADRESVEDFFDFFLIGFVLAFIVNDWNLTYGQSGMILLASGIS